MEQNHYQVLGVSKDATEKDIKRAYYNLAAKLHPDKAKDPEERKRNEDQLALVSAAYNILKDAQKRQDYDTSLSGKPSVPSGGGGASAGMTATSRPAGSSQAGSGPAVSGAAGTAAEGVKGADLQQRRNAIAERAFAKGMQLMSNKDYAGALQFFEAAVQNDDSKAMYQIKLAVCLIRSRGSYTRAAEAAQKAIAIDNYNVEYKLILADIHETAGALTAAKKAYEDVLRWAPENAVAKSRIAALSGQGDKPKSFFAGLFSKINKK